jgi:quercetin dioxygenase-like cupin family protein
MIRDLQLQAHAFNGDSEGGSREDRPAKESSEHSKSIDDARMSTPAELEELGRRIRKLRVDRRMTLKQVEMACGLSATHLSEIERGRTSPTIGALMRISRSLGKRPSFFIEREELADVARVPFGGGLTWTLATGLTAQSLSPGIPGGELFAYRLSFREGESAEWSLPPRETPGDATYLVLRGAVEAQIGDQRLTLAEGDAAQGPLTMSHRLKRSSAGSAEVLAVLTRSLEPPHSEGNLPLS